MRDVCVDTGTVLAHMKQYVAVPSPQISPLGKGGKAKEGFAKKVSSPTGNRTPVSRVTGGDTLHYIIEDP